jgi:hypothetical protein
LQCLLQHGCNGSWVPQPLLYCKVVCCILTSPAPPLVYQSPPVGARCVTCTILPAKAGLHRSVHVMRCVVLQHAARSAPHAGIHFVVAQLWNGLSSSSCGLYVVPFHAIAPDHSQHLPYSAGLWAQVLWGPCHPAQWLKQHSIIVLLQLSAL